MTKGEAVVFAREAGIRDHEWLEDQYDAIHRFAELVANAEREAGGHPLALEELASLRLARDRYETARRMNSRQWADAWKLNTTTGKPFDEIIDNMRPFMGPNIS